MASQSSAWQGRAFVQCLIKKDIHILTRNTVIVFVVALSPLLLSTGSSNQKRCTIQMCTTAACSQEANARGGCSGDRSNSLKGRKSDSGSWKTSRAQWKDETGRENSWTAPLPRAALSRIPKVRGCLAKGRRVLKGLERGVQEKKN